MKNTLVKKVLPPILVLILGFAAMQGIQASASEDESNDKVDTRPTVKIELASAQDYQVQITSYGEVKPVERTMLASQVSGEVIEWNENFIAGGLVRRGETLFSVEKDAYEAALLRAESDVSLAESQLIEEQARAKVAKQEAKQLPKQKVTDLYLRKPQVLSAQARLKSAQASLKVAKRDLANTSVTAPYDALVINRNIGSGQYVNQGSQVAELYNIEHAEITFPVAGFDNAFLPSQLQGQKAMVVSKGISNFTRTGLVARDLGVVDKGTRMGQLVIRVNDPYAIETDAQPLKFGSYVEVSFVGKLLQDVYRLPQEWVTNKTVWVVTEEKKLEPRNVEVVREEGSYFLVSGGLENEDRLVTTLPEYPQKGMDVKIDGEEDSIEETESEDNTLMAQSEQ